MALTTTNVIHGFLARFDDNGNLQGAAVEYREVKSVDGVEVASRILDPEPVALTDTDKIAEISTAINTASLASNVDKDDQITSLTNAKAQAEADRDAALAQVQSLQDQVQSLQNQIADLQKSASIRFIAKWQLYAGMRKDDPTGALRAAFDNTIASLAPAAKDLWNGCSGVEETSPFVVLAKQAPMSLTDAQINSMFDRYPNITQADVLALV